jgi:uncharacterized C2H2 Zn-finger protein
MKNVNLMMTGLAIGSRFSGGCQACNYDYSWLISKPSSLIYADKIIVTPYIRETIKKNISHGKDEDMDKAIRKIFEVAEDFDLIEVKSPNYVITDKIAQKIQQQVAIDFDLLKQYFPKSVKIKKKSSVPGEIFIDGHHFCQPSVWSIYASLYLAKQWNAESLFSPDVYTYCKYKFGLSTTVDQQKTVTAFDNIFSTTLPEKLLFPHYVFRNYSPISKCPECAKITQCKKSFLSDVEKNAHSYLELRDRDEIQQMKSVLNEIVKKLERTKSIYSHQDIIDEFHSEERKIKRDLKKTFPKFERWSNLTVIASIPITLFGVAAGSLPVAYTGQAISGVSNVLREAINYSKSKSKWVGFKNKEAIRK